MYGIIGVSGVALDLATFYLFHSLVGMNHQVANVLSTSIGITNNFFWNAFLNFKTKDNLLKRYISFYMVGLTGLALTAAILFVFVDYLKFDATVVKAGSLIFVLLVQYSLNKKFSFKKEEAAGSPTLVEANVAA
jgi:putative flippase GtrA